VLRVLTPAGAQQRQALETLTPGASKLQPKLEEQAQPEEPMRPTGQRVLPQPALPAQQR
jgi:hypothetical protein